MLTEQKIVEVLSRTAYGYAIGEGGSLYDVQARALIKAMHEAQQKPLQ